MTNRNRFSPSQYLKYFFLIALALNTLASYGQYANGTGTGTHQKDIFWLDWSAPLTKPAAATATNIVNGTYVWQISPTIQVEGVISNITTITTTSASATGGAGQSLTLAPYKSGSYVGNGTTSLGDGLQLLYPGINTIGLATSLGGNAVPGSVGYGVIQFDLSLKLKIFINATWTSTSFPGMVIADAESMNNQNAGSSLSEYISARSNGAIKWQLLDLRDNSASVGGDDADYLLDVSNNGLDFKIYDAPNTKDIGVQAVMYAHGATSITNIQMRGRGATALALGFVVPFDFGDAPVSYGNAGNYMDNFTFNQAFTSADGTYSIATQINKATLTPKAKLYMGANDVDADGNPQNSIGADADGADDNSATLPAVVKVNQNGDVTITTAATNGESATATIYGWIDFNGDGQFSSSEMISTTVAVGANNVAKTLTFLNSSFASVIKSKTTYARIRITTNILLDDAMTNVDERSITAAGNGETEDYKITIEGITISGTVFNDANGMSDALVNGTGIGTAGSTALYAYLVDASNNIVSKVQVASDGKYAFSSDKGNFTVVISANDVGVGNNLSTITANLPGNWVATGQTYGGNNVGHSGNASGTINLQIPVTTPSDNLDVYVVDFGIEQRPTALGSTTMAQPNVNPYTQTVASNAFTGTDADGTVQFIRITAFPANAQTIVVNGITYNSASFPAAGITIAANANGNPTQSVAIKPMFGVIAVTIPFVTIDNAGKESTIVNVIIPYVIILPVTFGNFSAFINDCSVVLTFETLTEHNNNRFIVQQSIDGQTWQALVTLLSLGNVATKQVYNYIQANPTQSIHYYRIEQVDADGSFSFSNTIVVNVSCNNKPKIQIYPNPVTNVLMLSGVKVGSNIKLLDANGKQLLEQITTTTTTTALKITTSSLLQGLYILQITNIDGTTVITKILKQ